MVKKTPERMCVACREMKPKKNLTRVVSDKEGKVFVDKTGKANGRGAYICTDNECPEKAKGSRALERAFKRKIPSEIWEVLKTGLE